MTRIPLTQDATVLGRHPYCEVTLNNALVSREHSRVIREGNSCFVEDLQSRNGTFLNGKMIKQRVLLRDGDHLNIGEYEFIFHTESPAPRETLHFNTGTKEHSFVLNESGSSEGLNITSRIKVASTDQQSEESGEREDIRAAYNKLKARLQTVIDLTRSLGRLSDFNELLPQFLNKLLFLFPNAESACFVVPTEDDRGFDLAASVRRNENNNEPFRVSRSVLHTVIQSKVGILSDDVGNDTRFSASNTLMHYQVSSIMAVPIFDQMGGDLLGVLQVDSLRSKPFIHSDLDLLVSTARQLSLHYENMCHQNARLKETMVTQEMSVAFQVQKGFLPQEPPKMENYTFFDYYRPARYLGGDYFDYIPLPGGRMAVAIGDVAGKGISAALLMAKLSSEVRYSLLLEENLAKAVERLNHVFSDNRWENRFITFQIAVLNPATHEVRLVNAGHVRPVLSPAFGVCRELCVEKGGFPIGIIPEATYCEEVCEFLPGDILTMMSDGLSDAMNAKGEYFELSRIYQILNNPQKLDAEELSNKVIGSVRNFIGGVQQSDDQCLVAFGRNR
ncbi:MAG: SpoIIE family protein phosphatase [Planctomycetia bacterium]|nr:SpoIIE family protein phosphatase [Planctomycetia bacterium]